MALQFRLGLLPERGRWISRRHCAHFGTDGSSLAQQWREQWREHLLELSPRKRSELFHFLNPAYVLLGRLAHIGPDAHQEIFQAG